MTMIRNAWLRTFFPRPNATLRLLFFPHAGGSASFYRSVAGALPEHVEPVIVQYPGREDRINEELRVDMDELVADLTEALDPLTDKPMWFFGHSMGASVAHEVTRLLTARDRPVPEHLIVSARPGPPRQRCDDKYLDDERLWADVREMGGTDAGLLAMPEVKAMALPMIRSDYRLIETYRARLDADLDIPLTACFSDRDPEVGREDAEAWRTATVGPFAVESFTGGHFYLREESERAVVDWLTERTGNRRT
ncbi:thioesterase II family protein [Actinopolyspora sp. H202]|uniref:thioesterase II family protein n=1 Tax=Actinopolyspora sp. H202 TaxID=1500456 RepID=UPI003F49DC97